MFHQAAPKQILQKKQISRQEYSFREEWNPETVNEYQVSHDESAKHQLQHQHQHQSQPPPQPSANLTPRSTIRPQPHSQSQHQTVYSESTSIQPRVPNKRTQARSSSLFEEWKAKALRSPDEEKEKAKEDDASPTASTAPKGNMSRGRGKSGKGIVSGDVRVLLGEHSDSTVNIRAKDKGSVPSVVEAAVQKQGNGLAEKRVIPVNATGFQEEHASKASTQVRTEEPGSCPVTLSQRKHRKSISRSKNLHVEGPTEKHSNEAESKDTANGPGTGPEAALKDKNERGESTARVRARSKEPGITSPVLPETTEKGKGSAASTSGRGASKDRTVTLRSTAKPATNDKGQRSEVGKTDYAAATSARGSSSDKTVILQSTAKPATKGHDLKPEAGKTNDAKQGK
ncbi:uncharacterized protein BDV14DRAFT_202861 [Aspergillus stella-maris]|uniref:uncharacterized protein n=1 Tax=Aspergillus stella-maris TaxID=1810926 RepID=UPI003CCDD01D